MEILVKTFEELSNAELYTLLQLRSAVFVVEQDCPYQDPDGKDQKALHVLLNENNGLAAYARILPPGVAYPECSIGRVVTATEQRGKGLGRQLMQHCLRRIESDYPGSDVVISAQAHLQAYYGEIGFAAEGEVYDEDDIPHIRMRRRSPV